VKSNCAGHLVQSNVFFIDTVFINSVILHSNFCKAGGNKQDTSNIPDVSAGLVFPFALWVLWR